MYGLDSRVDCSLYKMRTKISWGPFFIPYSHYPFPLVSINPILISAIPESLFFGGEGGG